MSDALAVNTGSNAATSSRSSPTARRFVRDWGDLADRWGADRTTAEVHALLYLSADPVDVRTIADCLSVQADEAVSGLEKLREMRVVRVVRREPEPPRYECVPDVWQMFHAILEDRRRREIEPAIAVLRDSVLRADSDDECDAHTVRRLEEMQTFLRDALGLYTQLGAMNGAQVKKLFKIGGKIRRALGASD